MFLLRLFRDKELLLYFPLLLLFGLGLRFRFLRFRFLIFRRRYVLLSSLRKFATRKDILYFRLVDDSLIPTPRVWILRAFSCAENSSIGAAEDGGSRNISKGETLADKEGMF